MGRPPNGPWARKDSEFFKKLLERHKGTPNKFTNILEHGLEISLGYEITLSKYYVEVKNENEFEIKINMKYLKELEDMLTRSEKDILDEVKHYDYTTFDDLIHKVMMSGNEVEYRLVSQLFSIGDTRYNLRTIVRARGASCAVFGPVIVIFFCLQIFSVLTTQYLSR